MWRFAKARRATRRRTALALFALSACFAAQSRAGDPEYGEFLSGQCTTCHQLSGKDAGIPSIVGWPVDSFVAVMNAYKTKERANKAMQSIAGSLGEEEIAALAAYFAGLPAVGQQGTRRDDQMMRSGNK